MAAKRQAVLSKLGFPPLVDVRGRYSIAERFPASKKRCGIYLLAFAGDLYYIGQAVDVVRRFGQHRAEHPDIHALSFQAAKPRELDELEKRLIRLAEDAELPLTNRIHVADVIGSTDFDLLMSAEEQQRWLDDPRTATSFEKSCARNQIGEAQARRYAQRFETYLSSPDFTMATRVLKTFVENCVPAFRRSEGSFWSLSCLPSTGRPLGPAHAVVNLRSTEVFVLGRYWQDANRFWGFANLAEDELLDSLGSLRKVQRAFPEATMERISYPSAGPPLLRLQTPSLQQMLELIADPRVQRAARRLTLRLARKGATLYSKFHCPQLAERVV